MYFDWNFDNGSCVRRSVEKGYLVRKIMFIEKQKLKRIKEKRVKNNLIKFNKILQVMVKFYVVKIYDIDRRGE